MSLSVLRVFNFLDFVEKSKKWQWILVFVRLFLIMMIIKMIIVSLKKEERSAPLLSKSKIQESIFVFDNCCTDFSAAATCCPPIVPYPFQPLLNSCPLSGGCPLSSSAAAVGVV